jgi:RNA polymerase sigma-70 factor (ECF subfamily)
LTITRNLAVDAIRLRRDHPVDPELMVTMITQTAEPTPDGTDHVRAVVRALPPDQARTVVLAVFYGLTAKEIAHQEGIPLGTAKTRIRRGLMRLRETLGVNDG